MTPLADTIVFMTVRNRAFITGQTVDDLKHGAGREFDLHIYDDRSDDELAPLLALYGDLLESGRIASLVMNRRVPSGVPWGKSFALRQFLASAEATIPADNRRYIVILDNDVELRPGWLSACVETLTDGISISRKLTVACPWVDPHYARYGTEVLARRPVYIQREHGAACWVAKWGFFRRHGLPDLTYLGHGHEEAWYVLAMRDKGESFACIPDMADPYTRGAASERVKQERERGERP